MHGWKLCRDGARRQCELFLLALCYHRGESPFSSSAEFSCSVENLQRRTSSLIARADKAIEEAFRGAVKGSRKCGLL